MTTMHSVGTVPRRLTALIGGLLLLLFATPAWACTLDEIFAMQRTGVPTEIIIEVIEATGLDDPLDEELLGELEEGGLDPAIVDYLSGYLPEDYDDSDETRGSDAWDGDLTNHPNWAGGDGFHHGGSHYNPLRDTNRGSDYWEGPYYRDDYRQGPRYRSYYDRRHIPIIYEPPVYMLYNHPYYRAYRAPRLYYYNRGYWDDGGYVMYDDRRHVPYGYTPPTYWNPWSRHHYYDDWWYDGWRGRGFRGSWSYDRHRGWDSRWDAWWRDDGISLRISL